MTQDGDPWHLGHTSVAAAYPADRGWLLGRIVPPPAAVRRSVEAQGLGFIGLEGVRPDLVNRAETLIAVVPSLAAIVGSMVDKLHPLKASPGYDISHSEPQWSSRIFVSIPDRSDDVGALRFAEGVVHEAMHLQLTLFEAQNPIVADLRGTMASPWRREERPYGGLAHGLFVFTCLRAFFFDLSSRKLGSISNHLQARIGEIQTEITSINLAQLSRGLTPLGAELVANWHAAAVSKP